MTVPLIFTACENINIFNSKFEENTTSIIHNTCTYSCTRQYKFPEKFPFGTVCSFFQSSDHLAQHVVCLVTPCLFVCVSQPAHINIVDLPPHTPHHPSRRAVPDQDVPSPFNLYQGETTSYCHCWASDLRQLPWRRNRAHKSTVSGMCSVLVVQASLLWMYTEYDEA